jgi:hypothetical protein
MEEISFIADRIKIYPPTAGEEVTVSFKTGVYSLETLQKAIPWQICSETRFKIIVQKESPDDKQNRTGIAHFV